MASVKHGLGAEIHALLLVKYSIRSVLQAGGSGPGPRRPSASG